MTTIALIDDHIMLRNGLAGIINSFEGYKVISESSNGREFIEAVKKQKPPDIVLLDITMPVMNGYDTALWIKKELSETKILVLSMMDNDNSIIRMIRNGARGYILKESKPVVLNNALNSVRDTGYYLNEFINNKMVHYLNTESETNINSFPSMNLSEREILFLNLAATEMTYKEIADKMNVSPRTVDSYRDDLCEKLKLKTRVGLVVFAIKNDIVRIR